MTVASKVTLGSRRVAIIVTLGAYRLVIPTEFLWSVHRIGIAATGVTVACGVYLRFTATMLVWLAGVSYLATMGAMWIIQRYHTWSVVRRIVILSGEVLLLASFLAVTCAWQLALIAVVGATWIAVFYHVRSWLPIFLVVLAAVMYAAAIPPWVSTTWLVLSWWGIFRWIVGGIRDAGWYQWRPRPRQGAISHVMFTRGFLVLLVVGLLGANLLNWMDHHMVPSAPFVALTVPPFLPLAGAIRPNDPVPLFRYWSSVPPHYLRQMTYDTFDGTQWITTAPDTMTYPPHQTIPNRSPLDALPVSLTVQTLRADAPLVTMGDLIEASVPVTVTSDRISSTGWSFAHPVATGTRYTLLSLLPITDVLPVTNTVPMDTYTALPSVPDTLRDIAHRWTDQAITQDDKVQAVIAQFQSNVYRYSLTNQDPPQGVDPTTWLLTTKVGYCSLYASAAAVLLRALHIPTRIAVGYTQGVYDAASGYWTVTAADAHAWIEVWYPDHGWVEYDPTSGYTITPLHSTAHPPTTSSVMVTPIPLPLTAVMRTPPIDGWWIGGVIGLSILILAGSMTLLSLAFSARPQRDRHRRPATRTEYWYARMVRRSLRVVPYRPSTTATEYGVQLCHQWPDAAAAITTITTAYVNERWGDIPPTDAMLRAAWSQIKRTQFGHRPRSGRAWRRQSSAASVRSDRIRE